MTKIETKMADFGYHVDSVHETRDAARDREDAIRQNSPFATWIRRSRAGWTLWLEAEDAYQKRVT